jgi:hypothetical protein
LALAFFIRAHPASQSPICRSVKSFEVIAIAPQLTLMLETQTWQARLWS